MTWITGVVERDGKMGCPEEARPKVRSTLTFANGFVQDILELIGRDLHVLQRGTTLG